MLNTRSRSAKHNGGETTHQGGRALSGGAPGGEAPSREAFGGGTLSGVTPRGRIPKRGVRSSNDPNKRITSLEEQMLQMSWTMEALVKQNHEIPRHA